MFKNIQTNHSYDITDIGFVERIVIGSVTPDKIPTDEENAQQMARLNHSLQTPPKGRIIGTERSFSLVRIGEHQVVLEAVAYHIGFKRKPAWMDAQAKTAGVKGAEVNLDAVEKIISES